MVGIVIVSHSAALAAGVLELASGMSGPDVKLAAAGGMDLPDQSLGTDATLIAQAIEKVYSDDGVIVLMDLGSAILSAEMALEMIPSNKRGKIALCAAPLVEGAVSAAVQSRIGSSLEQVVLEATEALVPKIDHLAPEKNSASDALKNNISEAQGDVHVLSITVTNPLGLHARPAARFVQTAGLFPDTEINVKNLTSGKGPVSARSINSVTTLGVSNGTVIEIYASGPQAESALAAFNDLADKNFGDTEEIKEDINIISTPAINRSSLPASNCITGLSGSRGLAIGSAYHFHPTKPKISKKIVEDSAREWSSLMGALEKTRKEIKSTINAVARRSGNSTSEIFEAHLLFLDDEALLMPVRRLIFENKYNSAYAWDQMIESMAEDYRALEEDYLRARAQDILDVGRQVLINLLGTKNDVPVLSSPGILIVPDLTPADTVHLDPSMVQAICTVFGSPSSHSAILARSFGIPAVVGLGEEILGIKEGTTIIVDAERGQILPNPDQKIILQYSEKIESLLEKKAKDSIEKHKPAVTVDGRAIEIYANIGLPGEVSNAVLEGAEGIGLFRTEFIFLDRDTAPNEEEQFDAYCEAAKAMTGRPVIIRTLDVGGDKTIPYLNLDKEDNPFLGWRAIRMCLKNPDFFKVQLRAIIRAAYLFPIKVMFPMIATLEEFRGAKSLLDEARVELKQEGHNVKDKIDTGIMVEIPAAALCAEQLAREADFFSIGTNDLTQYTMAAERGNSRISDLSDPLHPAILKLIKETVDAAHLFGKRVTVCGEAGGDPLAVPILIGMGVDELSMSVPAIPEIKALIRKLEFSRLKAIVQEVVKTDLASEVRTIAESFICGI